MNEKKKIIIIGGGIAGLAAAHFLCDYPEFDIELYESQDDVGGQARSMYGKFCYIEYSWRIFGKSYHNINNIINKIEANDNFAPLNHPCIINANNNVEYGGLSKINLGRQLVKGGNIGLINKLLNLFTIHRERAIHEYDNINAFDYFDNNSIIQTIMGPFLGMDANKISLSGYYKNVLSVSDWRSYHFTPKETRISKYPTQQSFFVPWVKYLTDRGVKIFTQSSVTNIIVNNDHYREGEIQYITLNNRGYHISVKGDEYIFACSLRSLNNIIRPVRYFNNTLIKSALQKLEGGLQLYYTINLYFSIELDSRNPLVCNEMILVDTPWKLIIQRKHLWGKKYLSKCHDNNRQIKDVFNVGFLDYNKGALFGKILNQCSKEEAITEGIYQFKNDPYILNLLRQHKVTFEEVYVGYEDWHEFQNDESGKLISQNPKFSTNVGMVHYMPKNAHPQELPDNMYLAGYYMSSTMGGASMESSCETGLMAGLAIVKKYKRKVIEQPYLHNIQYASFLTIGLVYIDYILYQLHLKSLNHIIPSSLLISLYLLLIIGLIILLIHFINYL